LKMKSLNEIGLWRKNKITGYWVLERTCFPEFASEWLQIFQKDEPDETFVLAKRRPKA